jgi:hypothetical protein
VVFVLAVLLTPVLDALLDTLPDFAAVLAGMALVIADFAAVDFTAADFAVTDFAAVDFTPDFATDFEEAGAVLDAILGDTVFADVVVFAVFFLAVIFFAVDDAPVPDCAAASGIHTATVKTVTVKAAARAIRIDRLTASRPDKTDTSRNAFTAT